MQKIGAAGSSSASLERDVASVSSSLSHLSEQEQVDDLRAFEANVWSPTKRRESGESGGPSPPSSTHSSSPSGSLQRIGAKLVEMPGVPGVFHQIEIARQGAVPRINPPSSNIPRVHAEALAKLSLLESPQVPMEVRLGDGLHQAAAGAGNLREFGQRVVYRPQTVNANWASPAGSELHLGAARGLGGPLPRLERPLRTVSGDAVFMRDESRLAAIATPQEAPLRYVSEELRPTKSDLTYLYATEQMASPQARPRERPTVSWAPDPILERSAKSEELDGEAVREELIMEANAEDKAAAETVEEKKTTGLGEWEIPWEELELGQQVGHGAIIKPYIYLRALTVVALCKFRFLR